MNDRQRGLFVDVVDLGSFSKAAERHFVTPQSVSQQIRRLEEELGFALLDRTAQGVAPTAAGRAFYEGCLRIGRELEVLVRHCAELAGAGDRAIRLGSSTTYSLALFSRFVPGFLRQNPDVRVEYVNVESAPLHGLLTGAYDVLEGVRPDGGAAGAAGVAPGVHAEEPDAVGVEGNASGGAMGVAADSSEGAAGLGRIAFLPLHASRRCCVVSARNPLSHRASVAPEDLRGQQVYVYSLAWAANLRAYLDARCPGIELREAPVAGHDNIQHLCDAEDVVYLAPEQLVNRFDPLIPIPFDADVTTEYGLLYREEDRPRLGPLLAAAREAFEERPEA